MLIQNALLANGKTVDVLVQHGRISAIAERLTLPEEETLNADGRTLLPAFVDLHCHWRTPGFEYKEDIATGSAAAAAGGYTFVNLMPNTNPVCSSAELAHSVMAQATALGVCDANQTVSITENFDGKTLDHLKTLPPDIRFITDDGKGVQSADTMAKAFAISATRGLTIMSHAEDMEVSPWDYRLAENLETLRNLHLAEYYNTRLHMCHVSTAEAISAIETAKWKGVPVTCEVCPHHIWFADFDYKVNPPIRQKADVDALVNAILMGTVDAISTDHAPHSDADKQNGMAGMVGLETAFGVCYTKLCLEAGLPLARLSQLMSETPALILGLQNKGRIEVGADADLVLVNLTEPYTVDKTKLHSKSNNTPFDGVALYGRVDTTLHAGRITYQR